MSDTETTLDTSALDDLDDIDSDDDIELGDEDDDPQGEPEAPASDNAGPSTEADPAAAAAAPPRDPATGQFARKPQGDTAQAPPAATEPVTPAPAQPAWEPFATTVNREAIPIEGVHRVSKEGMTYLVMPDEQAQRVQQMIGRGIQAERQWRAMQAERQAFEAEKAKPRPPSDTEVTAAVTLEYLEKIWAGDAETLDLLQNNPALLKRLIEVDAKDAIHRLRAHHQTQEQESARSAQEGQQVEQFFSQSLAGWVAQARDHEAYRGKLTDDEWQQLYTDLAPYAASFHQQVAKAGQITDRYGFKTDQLEREVDKAIRRALERRTQAAKAAEAASFNARQGNGKAQPPPPKPKPAPTAKNGRKPPVKDGADRLEAVFRSWNKSPGLDFGGGDDD